MYHVFINIIVELDDVVQIGAIGSNTQFLLNKTLEIMNNEQTTTSTYIAPTEDNTRSFNSTNIIAVSVTEPENTSPDISSIETISNLLSNVSNLKEVS